VITLEGLGFSYGGDPLFENMTLSIFPGQFTAFLGPNGSGKTTLLRLILGLLKPQSGKIKLKDQDLISLPINKRASLLSYVPQNMENTYDFTVEETVLMGRYHKRPDWQRETGEDILAAGKAMGLMEVDSLRKRSVRSLSGGERQRVLIARALAQETPVILLDEPTAFLDLRHQHSIMKLLRQITRNEKKTVISVVHDLNLALSYADRAVLLEKGSLRGNGLPGDVLNPAEVEQVYGVRTELITRGTRTFIVPLDD